MPSPDWQVTFAQSPGAQHEQQDHGAAWPSEDGKQMLIVLADGAGGHQGGRQASYVAIEAARTLWTLEPPREDESPAFLQKISRSAHDAVAAEATSERASRSTWLALLLTESEAHWAHSGDTRLYHFTSGSLIFRTLDHSLVQAMVETGKMEAAETGSHSDRNILLQSLGGPQYIPVESDSCSAGRDDLFLLCTDGVWNELDNPTLYSLARCAPDEREHLTNKIVETAVMRGGKRADNASLWCVARK